MPEQAVATDADPRCDSRKQTVVNGSNWPVASFLNFAFVHHQF